MVAMIEGLYLALLSGGFEDRYQEWAETLVEANFLEITVFSKKETEEDDYMLDLLNRIQKLLLKETQAFEEAAQLSG